MEFTTWCRRRSSEAGLIIHRVSIDPVDVEQFRGFRCTTAARTIVDLAGVTSPENVELAFESALRARVLATRDVRETLERSVRTKSGRAVIRSLLEAYPGTPTASALETLSWRLLRESGLPLPTRQFEIRDGGRFVGRADFAYPEAKLVIEADGYKFHGSEPDWRRDRRRQNAFTKLGWIVYRITWDDVRGRRRRVIADIAELIDRRPRQV